MIIYRGITNLQATQYYWNWYRSKREKEEKRLLYSIENTITM